MFIITSNSKLCLEIVKITQILITNILILQLLVLKKSSKPQMSNTAKESFQILYDWMIDVYDPI